jgi:hypothetical protein
MEDVRTLGGLRVYSTLFADDLASFRTLTAAQEESWRSEPLETTLMVRDALSGTGRTRFGSGTSGGVSRSYTNVVGLMKPSLSQQIKDFDFGQTWQQSWDQLINQKQ